MQLCKTVFTLLLVASVTTACSDSAETTSNNPLTGAASPLADDATTNLEQSVLTGASSADTDAFWLCTVTNNDVQINNFVMQFWADKTGVAGQESMSWAVEGEAIAVDFAEGEIAITNIAFGKQDNGSDKFSASSNKNDQLNCDYNGPAQQQTGAYADASSAGDTRILNNINVASDIWTCLATDTNNETSSRHYAFWENGLGSSHSGNFNWFYNDDDNIVLSYSDQILELRDIDFNGEQTQPTTFSAAERQYQLNCTR